MFRLEMVREKIILGVVIVCAIYMVVWLFSKVTELFIWLGV